MQLEPAMIQVAPFRSVNAISAAAIGKSTEGTPRRRVRPAYTASNDDVQIRTISWERFAELTGRTIPPRPAKQRKAANSNRPNRAKTAEQAAAARARIEAEKQRVDALVAAHAAYLAQRVRAHRFRRGYPLLQTVLKDNPGGALSLLRAISRSDRQVINEAAIATHWAGSDDHEPEGPAAEPLSSEFIHDIRPSINLMMADVLRVRVTRTIDGKYIRSNKLRSDDQQRILLADMVFSTHPHAHRPAGGLMVSYGTDGKGKPKLPVVKAERPRGGYSNKRDEAAISSYLSLHGFKAEQTYVTAPKILPDMLDKTPDAVIAQRNLDEWTASTRHMPAVQYCPPAIAKGALFLGGIKKPKKGVQCPRDVHDRDEPDLALLSPMARHVLDAVANRSNLKRLGLSLGYSENYADRAAKRILEAMTSEVVALIPPPANDNMRQAAAPANVPYLAA